MKKLIFVLILLLALPVVLADVSVIHSIGEIKENEQIVVHAIVRADSETGGFDLGEFIPVDWEVKDWAVENYEKDEVKFESEQGEFLEKMYNINHWTFEDISQDIAISYAISPKQAGDYEIVSVWFHPAGFEMGVTEFSIKKASASPITGFAVGNLDDKEIVSSGNANTKVDIINTVSNVLENINSIELY